MFVTQIVAVSIKMGQKTIFLSSLDLAPFRHEGVRVQRTERLALIWTSRAS